MVHGEGSPVVVVYLHGIGGIGKSCLLQALRDRTQADVRWYGLDCRHVEPTPDGFLDAVYHALAIAAGAGIEGVVQHFGTDEKRAVLALDTYEAFGLMDTWLRQEFIPALPDNVMIVIAGREAPKSAWMTTPGWQDLFCEIKLDALTEEQSHQLLERRGLAEGQIQRVLRSARGHPLALELAAMTLRNQPDLEITEGPPPSVVQQLTEAFMQGLPEDQQLPVEAASIVFHVTEDVLGALLDNPEARELLIDLRTLPFVTTTADGLTLHDIVRETIADDLAQRDPERHRTYHLRAWQMYRRITQSPNAGSLWRYTVDMLYLLKNPNVREGFFPQGATDIAVEPATEADAIAIKDIAASTDDPASAEWIDCWWRQHPEAFSCTRDRDGMCTAFYLLFEPNAVDQVLLAADPITAAWSRHLVENPVSKHERTLFLRRWLARDAGEQPCPEQGACWIDIKRTYMAWRPSLRRLYATLADLSGYMPALSSLGFRPLPEAEVALGHTSYNSAVLDFGPHSVDGWLSTLIGKELGLEETVPHDEGAADQRTRRMLTLLFIDIVGSTEKAEILGDRDWRQTLEAYYALVRRQLVLHEGNEINTAGDGFLAAFEGPTKAIQCALSLNNSIGVLGIEVRIGVHCGECEVIGSDIAGITVHTGSRIASLANAGEVLVSQTVRDLAAGSGIRFEDKGAHVLKGIRGEWPLFSIAPS